MAPSGRASCFSRSLTPSLSTSELGTAIVSSGSPGEGC
jgi:hypothetical protein